MVKIFLYRSINFHRMALSVVDEYSGLPDRTRNIMIVNLIASHDVNQEIPTNIPKD